MLTLAAGLLLAGAAGCGQARGEEGGDDPTTASGAPGSGTQGSGALGPGAADGGSPAAEPVEPGAGGGTKGGGSSGGGTSGGGTSGGGPDAEPEPAGPRIVHFRVTQKPACPGGTNLHPVPGRPLVIEWKVTGATKVELAVDGPGAYNTYGAQGSETFTFSCGGPAGTIEKHTYRLTTVDGGAARSQTISATAKVNEIPVVDG